MEDLEEADAPMMDQFSSDLKNMLTTIIGAREGDTIVEALHQARIMDVSDLLDVDITEDTFVLPPVGRNKNPTRLLPVIVTKLQNISTFAQHVTRTESRLLKNDDWASLTKEAYTTVMMNLRNQSPATRSPSQPLPHSSSRSQYTPTEIFKKGIKRDPTAFPVLKQQK